MQLKMIFRTVIEDIIVRTDDKKETLHFTIHWNGGVQTQLEIDRPRAATETATSMEALETIRRMAVRHGDESNRIGAKSTWICDWQRESLESEPGGRRT